MYELHIFACFCLCRQLLSSFKSTQTTDCFVIQITSDFTKIRCQHHPEWLANPVLVQKKNNNEWRMCANYTDLNKHCPKDPFRLPHIDQVIDSTVGCVLLFLPRLLLRVSSDRPERRRPNKDHFRIRTLRLK